MRRLQVRGLKVQWVKQAGIKLHKSIKRFDSSTEYYLLIDATAFEDGANNAYAGISSTTALSFTSVDNANPTLSSSTPADDAKDVELDANIVLNLMKVLMQKAEILQLKRHPMIAQRDN